MPRSGRVGLGRVDRIVLVAVFAMLGPDHESVAVCLDRDIVAFDARQLRPHGVGLASL